MGAAAMLLIHPRASAAPAAATDSRIAFRSASATGSNTKHRVQTSLYATANAAHDGDDTGNN